MGRGDTTAHLCLDVGLRFDLLDGALAESEAAGMGAAALLDCRADGGGVTNRGGAVPS